jgi:hypothetical protein
MRGLIALQSTACEIAESVSSVSRSFGVRTRPRVAFHAVTSSSVTKRESFYLEILRKKTKYRAQA